MRPLLPCLRQLWKGVNHLELFTSLAALTRSVREREEGQGLAHEAVALALIIFAVLGAISLLGRLT